MNKELIDRAWACLPREFKEKVKKKYARCVKIDEDDNSNLPAYAVKSAITRRALLENLFGIHNLTSDAEGEEMLTVKRSDVINEFDKLHKLSYKAADLQVGLNAFRTLFGSKCLPDELNEDNFAKSEPKPSEPKEKSSNSTELKSQEVDKHFDAIIKDGFREHNRLHIAAMIMSGLLASGKEKHPVRRALDLADALIAEAEKGGDNA